MNIHYNIFLTQFFNHIFTYYIKQLINTYIHKQQWKISSKFLQIINLNWPEDTDNINFFIEIYVQVPFWGTYSHIIQESHIYKSEYVFLQWMNWLNKSVFTKYHI